MCIPNNDLYLNELGDKNEKSKAKSFQMPYLYLDLENRFNFWVTVTVHANPAFSGGGVCVGRLGGWDKG